MFLLSGSPWHTHPHPLLLNDSKKRGDFIVVLDDPTWHRDIKSRALRTLLGEIHRAREVNCPTLTVLGLRSALDTMCNLMWEDLQTFDAKLKRLLDEGLIGPKQRRLLTAAVEIGHAATHRAHIPTKREADMVSDIVEGLIKQHYSLNKRVEMAAARVPKRKRYT